MAQSTALSENPKTPSSSLATAEGKWGKAQPVLGAALAFCFLLALGGRLFPLLYFPAACIPGLYGAYQKNASAFLTLLALGAVFYFSAPPLSAIIATAAAAAGFAAGMNVSSSKKYFRTLVSVFFSALTVWLLLYIRSGADVLPLFWSKISRIFIFSMAGRADNYESASSMAFTTLKILPALAAMFVTAGFLINVYIMKAMGGSNAKRIMDGSAFRALPAYVFPLIISLAGAVFHPAGFFPDSASIIRVISVNILLAALFMFFISGLGIYWFLMKESNTPSAARVFFTGILVFLYPVPAITGILDRWIDFRKMITGAKIKALGAGSEGLKK